MQRHITLMATLCLAAATSLGFAQTDSQDTKQQDQKPQTQTMQRGESMPGMRLPGRRIVVGEVTDMRDVTVKGIDKSHRLLKMNANDNTVIVDLGGMQNAMPTIEKGDQIIALGVSSRVNGKPVIRARYVGEVYPYVPVVYDVGASN